jgi:hypothetical protein
MYWNMSRCSTNRPAANPLWQEADRVSVTLEGVQVREARGSHRSSCKSAWFKATESLPAARTNDVKSSGAAVFST